MSAVKKDLYFVLMVQYDTFIFSRGEVFVYMLNIVYPR